MVAADTTESTQLVRKLHPGDDGNNYRVQPRIVGGSVAAEERFPYIAAIFNVVEEETGDASRRLAYKCTGSLIAPNVVITAAHCLENAKVVIIGQHDLLFDPIGDYEIFEVANATAHPDWKGLAISANNDYLLLELSGESRFDPVKLNRDEKVPQQDAPLSAIGWGTTTSGSEVHSPYPVEAVLEYQTNEECQSRFDGYEIITRNMMCTWSPGKDACQGDSGGPLLQKGADAGEDVLMGLVSWGYDCAHPLFPGVHARISSVIDWIDETTCNISPSHCAQIVASSQTQGKNDPPLAGYDIVASFPASSSPRAQHATVGHILQMFGFVFLFSRLLR